MKLVAVGVVRTGEAGKGVEMCGVVWALCMSEVRVVVVVVVVRCPLPLSRRKGT